MPANNSPPEFKDVKSLKKLTYINIGNWRGPSDGGKGTIRIYDV